MNVESIAEVKVLVSNYQAEYGRSSGLQITAVTKSGTNRFRGSVYDVERNSDWNSNSKINKLNGDPKTVSKERDWGYSIGGPVGKPGGNNKLFFFYSQEFAAAHGRQRRAAVPLADGARARGRFLADDRQQRQPVPVHQGSADLRRRVPRPTRRRCFADGGVVGRIPQNRLYQTGLNMLNMFPMPNITNVPAGQTYNYQITRPSEQLLAWQPAIRLDYNAIAVAPDDVQVLGLGAAQADDQRIDSRLERHANAEPGRRARGRCTANYTLTPTMFLEAHVRPEPERAGRLRARAEQHRADLLHERASR